MTQTEFQYIKRAVEAIESGTLTLEEEIKVYRTVSQITERAAKETANKLVDISVA